MEEVQLSQRRLIRYFLRDDAEQVGDIYLELRPLPSDIPELDQSYYDARKDNLVILFKCSTPPAEKALSENVSLFFDPDTAKIAGVKVHGVRQNQLHSLTLAIQRTLEDYSRTLRESMERQMAWKEQLRRIGRWDIEKRKLKFFVNELPRAVTGLSAASRP